MITFQTENIEMPAIDQAKVRDWVRNVAASYQKKVGEIAYFFCDDEKILEVNRQYLQHDYYTDIITFDYCEGNKLSGDLFISLDTVRSNSELFGTDYNTELHRVIIHGVLSTSAALTTKVLVNEKSWKLPRTVPWSCCIKNQNF